MSNTVYDIEANKAFLNDLPFPASGSFGGSGVGSSPTKPRRINADSTFRPDLGEARAELRDTMRGKINILPVDSQDYTSLMQDFLPRPRKHKSTPNIFSNVPKFSSEQEMYMWIVDLLNNSKLFPHYSFVATPYKADVADPSRQAIDCGMYHRDLPPEKDKDSENQEMTHNRRVNWSRLEMGIECKHHNTDQDPFDDRQADGEPVAEKRKKALGQILSYAELVFKYQQRTFQYMVLFLGKYARVVHFDRSGAYSTAKFEYKTQGAALTHFLLRYSRLSRENRGIDPTAHRIEPDSEVGRKMLKWGRQAAEAKPADHDQQLFNQSLDTSRAWWKLEVHVEKKAPNQRSGRADIEIQKFVVGKPHFQASGVVGRGTRGYVAVRINENDELEGPFVYLKDAWRVDHPGIEREGSVLQTLNEKNVPFVPTLVCHGDLSGPTQVTRSQAVWEANEANKGKTCRMKKHRHYRLVVQEVGKPLHQFDRGFTLVFAILCCIVAHHKAYKLAGIIHRDISAGNILLYKNSKGVWVGLLNDWELSKLVGEESGARQPDRTGTWQFMSVHALNNPHKDIIIADEIESFFHVLLYFAVRFLPHNINPLKTGQFLIDYFDGYSDDTDGYSCGRAKQEAMSRGSIPLRTYNKDGSVLEFYKPVDSASETSKKSQTHPINEIFKTLLGWFHAHYTLDQPAEAQTVRESPTGKDDQAVLALQTIMASLDEGDDIAATDDKAAGEGQVANGSSSALPDAPPKSPLQSSVTNTANLASLRAEAEKLQTHTQVIDLFKAQVSGVLWPFNDKGPDQKPPIVLPPRRQPVLTPSENDSSTTSTSSKRSLEDADIRPSKRSRIDGLA